MPRRAGYEADDFLAAAVAAEERRGGTVLVASGDRDTFQLASDRDDDPVSGAGRRDGADRPGRGARALRRRARAGAGFHRACAATRRTSCPAFPASARKALPTSCGSTARSKRRSRPAGFRRRPSELRLFRSIATMDAKAPLPPLKDQRPSWAKASALARDWQLNALADRLAKLAWTRRYTPILTCGLFAGGRPTSSIPTATSPKCGQFSTSSFISVSIYIWLLIAAAVLSWLVAFNVVNVRNQFVAHGRRISSTGSPSRC